ncbi:MAG: response regulator [Elusimicrobia bacterium]|nr:response regulator [Elusimicrobiota bacterium]
MINSPKRQRNQDLLRISEIARKAEILPSKIRYYTDMGLLNVKGWTQGGHRLYDEQETLQRLNSIEFLSKKGVSITEIKKELNSTIRKKKLLVIDDEPEIGDLISDLIKQMQTGSDVEFDVKVVYDGFSAGRLISEYVPDLIILDLLLPGVDGFEVCREIKNAGHLVNTKVLAVTGYDSPENRKKILQAGADDFLAKPLEVQAIREKIKNLLGIEK